MNRTLKIVLGIVGILVGMAFVMPAIAQWRHEGAMTNSSIVLCSLGMVMTLAGIGAARHGVARRSA